VDVAGSKVASFANSFRADSSVVAVCSVSLAASGVSR
jgi:hypothetical protein